MTLNLTAELGHRLQRAAREDGVSAAEYTLRLLDRHVPRDGQAAALVSLLQSWIEEEDVRGRTTRDRRVPRARVGQKPSVRPSVVPDRAQGRHLVSLVVALDAGPLGLVTNPKRSPESLACAQWLQALVAAGARVVLPEIADYEVRRELLRGRRQQGLRRLDAIVQTRRVPAAHDRGDAASSRVLGRRSSTGSSDCRRQGARWRPHSRGPCRDRRVNRRGRCHDERRSPFALRSSGTLPLHPPGMTNRMVGTHRHRRVNYPATACGERRGAGGKSRAIRPARPVLITVTNRTETAAWIKHAFDKGMMRSEALRDPDRTPHIDSKVRSEAQASGEPLALVDGVAVDRPGAGDDDDAAAPKLDAAGAGRVAAAAGRYGRRAGPAGRAGPERRLRRHALRTVGRSDGDPHHGAACLQVSTGVGKRVNLIMSSTTTCTGSELDIVGQEPVRTGVRGAGVKAASPATAGVIRGWLRRRPRKYGPPSHPRGSTAGLARTTVPAVLRPSVGAGAPG